MAGGHNVGGAITQAQCAVAHGYGKNSVCSGCCLLDSERASDALVGDLQHHVFAVDPDEGWTGGEVEFFDCSVDNDRFVDLDVASIKFDRQTTFERDH